MAKVKKKKVKKQIKQAKSLRDSKNNSKVRNNKKKSCKKQVISGRGDNGQFVKGVSGNPNGKPKGKKNKFSIAELSQAIKNVEGRLHTTFMEAWIESAWGDATAMSNIANFMLPKLRAIEQVTFIADSMEDKEAEQIRKEMLERFKE